MVEHKKATRGPEVGFSLTGMTFRKNYLITFGFQGFLRYDWTYLFIF